MRKLNLGCGHNVLEGWVNSDANPPSTAVTLLDVENKFPFTDNEFDYIFSEHMIEHLPYEVGSRSLKECYRVLKPRGVVRVSTPDLAFLVDLYTNSEADVNKRYWGKNKELGDRMKKLCVVLWRLRDLGILRDV